MKTCVKSELNRNDVGEIYDVEVWCPHCDHSFFVGCYVCPDFVHLQDAKLKCLKCTKSFQFEGES